MDLSMDDFLEDSPPRGGAIARAAAAVPLSIAAASTAAGAASMTRAVSTAAAAAAAGAAAAAAGVGSGGERKRQRVERAATTTSGAASAMTDSAAAAASSHTAAACSSRAVAVALSASASASTSTSSISSRPAQQPAASPVPLSLPPLPSSSSSSSPLAGAAAAGGEVLPDIHAAEFQCPLCCKHLKARVRSVSARLLHVCNCALANGLDMITQVRPRFAIREAEWLEWITAHNSGAYSSDGPNSDALVFDLSGDAAPNTAFVVPFARPPTASSSSLPSPSPPPASAIASSAAAAASAASTVAAPPAVPAAKAKKARASKSSSAAGGAMKPLSLDSALGATKAGSGVGTALSHIKPPPRKRSSGAAGLASAVGQSSSSQSASGSLAAARDTAWEVSQGVFLLGEHFELPNPPAQALSVKQLERRLSTLPAEEAAATTMASTAAQLYSWRHYIHETDVFVRTVLQKRQWALVKYRLLQERLASEGGDVDSLRLEPVCEGHELPLECTPEDEQDGQEGPGEARASMWALGASSHASIPPAAFLKQLPLQNRQQPSILSVKEEKSEKPTMSTTISGTDACAGVPTSTPAAAPVSTAGVATLWTAVGAASTAAVAPSSSSAATASTSSLALPPRSQSASAVAGAATTIPSTQPVASAAPSGFTVLPPLPSSSMASLAPAPTAVAASVPPPAATPAAASPTVNIWRSAKALSSPAATQPVAACATAPSTSFPHRPTSIATPAASTPSTPPVTAGSAAAPSAFAQTQSTPHLPAAAEMTAEPATAVAPVHVAPSSTSVTVAALAADSAPAISAGMAENAPPPTSHQAPAPSPPACVSMETAAPTSAAAYSNTLCMAVRVPSPFSLMAANAAATVTRPLPLPLPLPFPLSAEDPQQEQEEDEAAAVAMDDDSDVNAAASVMPVSQPTMLAPSLPAVPTGDAAHVGDPAAATIEASMHAYGEPSHSTGASSHDQEPSRLFDHFAELEPVLQTAETAADCGRAAADDPSAVVAVIPETPSTSRDASRMMMEGDDERKENGGATPARGASSRLFTVASLLAEVDADDAAGASAAAMDAAADAVADANTHVGSDGNGNGHSEDKCHVDAAVRPSAKEEEEPDHDSAFSLSQPSLPAAALLSQNSQQPGLDVLQAVDEGGEVAASTAVDNVVQHEFAVASGALSAALAAAVPEPESVLGYVTEEDDDAEVERKECDPAPLQRSHSAPSPRKAIAAAVSTLTQAHSPCSAAARAHPAPFLTARAIIELLSDDDEQEGAHAHHRMSATVVEDESADVSAFLTQRTPPGHVQSRKRGRRVAMDTEVQEEAEEQKHGNDDGDDDQSVEELLVHASQYPPRRQHVPRSSVVSARDILAQTAPAPLEWKPASARKLWDQAMPPAAAAAPQAAPSGSHLSIASLAPVAAVPAAPVAPPQPLSAAKRARKEPASAAPAASPNIAAAIAPAPPPLPPPPPPAVRCAFVSLGAPSLIQSSFGSCCLPRFESLDVDTLKDVMAAFGLKPRSKAQMTAKLAALWISMAKQKGVQLNEQGQLVQAAHPLPPPPAVAPPKRKRAADAAAATAAADPALLDITLAAANGSNAAPSDVMASSAAAGAASSAASAVVPPAKKKPRTQAAKDVEPAASPVAAAASAAVQAAAPVSPNDAGGSLSRFPFLPSPMVSPELAASLRAWLRSQVDLHARVLLFQPLEVRDVWLCAQAAGLRCDPLQLRSFLDAEGISNTLKDINSCNTNNSGKHDDEQGAHAKPARKGAAHVPKGRFRRR